jgi:hypothetical protein
MTRQSGKKNIELHYYEAQNIIKSLDKFHLRLTDCYNYDFYLRKNEESFSPLEESELIFNYLKNTSLFDQKNQHHHKQLRLPHALKILFTSLQHLNFDEQSDILGHICYVNPPLFHAYLHKLSLKHLVGPLKLIEAIPFTRLKEKEKSDFFRRQLKKMTNVSLDFKCVEHFKYIMKKHGSNIDFLDNSLTYLSFSNTPAFNHTCIELNFDKLLKQYTHHESMLNIEAICYKLINIFEDDKAKFSCEHMEFIPKDNSFYIYLYGANIEPNYLHNLFDLQIQFMLSKESKHKALMSSSFSKEVIEKLQFEKSLEPLDTKTQTVKI